MKEIVYLATECSLEKWAQSLCLVSEHQSLLTRPLHVPRCKTCHLCYITLLFIKHFLYYK